MGKIFFRGLIIIGVLLGGYFFHSSGTSYLFQEYRELMWYRRLTPGILPRIEMIRTSDAGHTTTYADTLWINLIQYIGDNTRNNLFLEFLYPITDQITSLHPGFIAPYNLATLLAPNPDREKPNYEESLSLTKKALEIGKKGMRETCDGEKIKHIEKTEVGGDFWERKDLQNPCRNGMLPYYMANILDRLGERSTSEKYYKIASLNSDAPKVSRFLMLLERAKDGNYEDAGRKFLLTGIAGYDEDPYSCQSGLSRILVRFSTRSVTSEEDISFLKSEEKKLTPPKDTKNPLASSVTSCYESGRRGIKQFYISYIDHIASSFSGMTFGSGLREQGLMRDIPALESQKDWDIKKLPDGNWQYIPQRK